MRWNKYILVMLTALCSATVVHADDTVWFVYEGANKIHAQYVSKSEEHLHELLPDLVIKHLVDEGAVIEREPDDRVLIISVGAKAASKAAQYRLPTINTLVTSRTFMGLRDSYHSPVSSVFVDQPVIRYLQLIKAALPQRIKITVLVGSETPSLVSEINKQAAIIGMELRVIEVSDNSDVNTLFGNELLAEDTLLLLPDSAVVNRQTIKPLVLGSYRYAIPLIGYSKALVKAGALMSVHASVETVEEEMVKYVNHFFVKHTLLEPGFTGDFEVSVNYQLARALKLSLPPEDTLKRQMREARR